MKRILTLFLSIVMCIGMTACGSKPKNKYEEYVLSFVQDFQTQNFDAMYKLTSDQYPYFQECISQMKKTMLNFLRLWLRI